MTKQLGISSLELLLSLAVISSISAYTLTMSEEVGSSIQTYQQETNVKEMLKKIKGANVATVPSEPMDAASQALANELLNQPVDALLEHTSESLELSDDSETLSHS